MTHDPREAQHAVERIILRRIYERRIEGYTIETAKEIVGALTASPGEQEPQPAAGWNEAISAAMTAIENMRVKGAANLVDARHQGQRGCDYTDTLYDAYQAVKALRREAPAPEGVAAPQLDPRWRTELDEIIGHLGAAVIQSCDKDDQIIMNHVRAAHEIAKVVRRQA